jgi:hypothetical protein
MKYEMPQIVCSDSAVLVIQSTSKAVSMQNDSKGQEYLTTISAYQADE